MRINSVEQYLELDPSQLANTIIACPYCRRDHTIPFREIHYGTGAIQNLFPSIQRRIGHIPTCIGLVFDKHIEEIIEASIIPALRSNNIKLLSYALGEKNHHLEPSDFIGEAAARSIDPSVEFLIGAGSGVICDLTKLIADTIDRPFALCGTAVSMNAYTSITGIITENKFKTSKFFKVCDTVIMDTGILAEAPVAMSRAGMGDLAARAICNADFRMSHLLKKTSFCPLPFLLTAPYEKRYLAAARGIGTSEPEAIETLSQATLISGYSMTIMGGETFPSSGAEHVLSHFWDLQHALFNSPRNLHGAQVAIGSLISLTMYEFLRKFQPTQFNISKIIRNRPSLAEIQKENLLKFGEVGKYFNQVILQKWLPNDTLEKYLDELLKHWEEIWNDLDTFITSHALIYQAFRDAGVPSTLKAISRNKDEALDALIFGNRYRKRFTILDLLWELGLLPEAADEILVQSRVLDG